MAEKETQPPEELPIEIEKETQPPEELPIEIEKETQPPEELPIEIEKETQPPEELPIEIEKETQPPEELPIEIEKETQPPEELPIEIEKETQPPEELPIVLVHRSISFSLPSKHKLSSHFHLLDPHDFHSPHLYDSFLSRHAHSIRAVIIVGPYPLPTHSLDRLPALELIVATSAGLDHLDLPACRSRGITVTNASVAFAEDVADCAVGLLIDVLRRISAADRFVRSRMWSDTKEYPLGFKLGEKRVAIVGLGSIGSEVAKRLSAFGCTIAYTSRKKKQSVPFPFYANVRDLAADSDVLILCCALTEETHHMINKDVMTTLGKAGVIINVGRGSLIDEKEMVKCLVQGEIGGAGLDVYENEPNVPKELFGLDNVVLSPHSAITTPQAFEALSDLIFGNLTAFFSNKPLVSVVSNE